MYLLAANSTLRTILVLLVIWQLLRLWQRYRGGGGSDKGGGGGAQRRPGDVTIENIGQKEPRSRRPDAEDADYEVIK